MGSIDCAEEAMTNPLDFRRRPVLGDQGRRRRTTGQRVYWRGRRLRVTESSLQLMRPSQRFRSIRRAAPREAGGRTRQGRPEGRRRRGHAGTSTGPRESVSVRRARVMPRLSIRLVFVRRGDEAAESFRRAMTQET